MWQHVFLAGSILIAGLLLGGFLDPVADAVTGKTAPEMEDSSWKTQVANRTPQKATFAGGCFWCIEAVYQGRKGIGAAISGYAGGKQSTATYAEVSSGTTDHREAVRLRYYPSIISYERLLDIYWRSIDPTDPRGQFADRGPQYTTAIYAHTPRQWRLAKRSKRELAQGGRFDEPIVTAVLNATTFFRAEAYHQNFSMRNTARYELYVRASGRKSFLRKTWNTSK
ncbi:MAG: peptide-methionine (S)-S-oxide reductase MsrA [Candidatus Nanohaloarchaea archaeon]|nr:peptide-methionine (S)-S-oxide reductase MsrA [Candidatus Nanohaloarchaea archaeon]